jgi:hypothetical protein
MSKEGAIVCAQEKYNDLLNELRRNYQMYYDTRTLSHKDFYRRRAYLIMKLRTMDINQKKPLLNDISNYPYDYENIN